MIIEWTIDPATAFTKLVNQYGMDIERVIEAIIKGYQPLIEDWMRSNAKWGDITGDARKGLTTEVTVVLNDYVMLQLKHTVDYGVYLEGWNPKTNSPMANAGKWSIIEPALDHFKGRIWADINKIFKLR